MKRVTEQECIEEFEKIVNYKLDLTPKEKSQQHNKNVPYTIEEAEIEYDGILLDDEDIKTVLLSKEHVFLETIEIFNFEEAKKALTQMIENFEKMEFPLKYSEGILVYFTLHSNEDFILLSDIVSIIFNSIDNIFPAKEPDCIWGIKCDDKMKKDKIKMSIFTSFNQSKKKSLIANNIEYKKS